MSQKILIQKASGELVPFSEDKLKGSLLRVGANDQLARLVIDDILSWIENGMPTRKIYGRAFALLRKYQRSAAARYSLKKAMMEMGPSGYPFEQFVGEVFKAQGYQVEVGQEVAGMCVQHEVDVIATNHRLQHLVECKFYNSQGKYASVQVPLYIRSRVNDIVNKRQTCEEYRDFEFQGWVVTNTRFTSDALAFGTCSGLKLLSWDHPQEQNLKQLVEQNHLFPVTALTSLTKSDKQILLEKGVVLCRHIMDTPQVLNVLQMNETKRRRIMAEVSDLLEQRA